MQPVVEYAHANFNIRIINYADDILLVAKTRKESKQKTETFVNLLKHLGIVINFKKCKLKPSRRLEFLGYTIDTKAMTLYVPRRNVKKLRNYLSRFLEKRNKDNPTSSPK